MKASGSKAAKWTHSALTGLAVKWLKRPNNRGGHGCQVALSEVAGGWTGEIPDAIGFRNEYHGAISVVVEVKVSRQDFLSDKKKSHRNPGKESAGMGNYRYYMCPEGLIKPEELPDKWGLLWVNSRGHIKAIKSPFLLDNYYERLDVFESMLFEANSSREIFLLTALLVRVGDPEVLNLKLREMYKTLSSLEKRLRKEEADNKNLRRENRRLQNTILEMEDDTVSV